MDYVSRVAIVNAGKDLLQKDGSIPFIELSSPDDFVKEFPAFDMLCHYVESLFVLKVLVDFENIGVVKFSENSDFIHHYVFFWQLHFGLVEDFDYTLLFSVSVGRQTDFAILTLAYRLSNLVHLPQQQSGLLNEHSF